MKAYLANGLFSESDRIYNEQIAQQVRRALAGHFDLYVPQENPALNDKSGYADSEAIFNGDNEYLDNADILIAVLDGQDIDSGVAAEIGRFVTLKEVGPELDLGVRYIYGLYTDVRQLGRDNAKKIDALIQDGTENQFMYRNLYVVGAIKKHGKIVSSLDDLVKQLKEDHNNE